MLQQFNKTFHDLVPYLAQLSFPTFNQSHEVSYSMYFEPGFNGANLSVDWSIVSQMCTGLQWGTNAACLKSRARGLVFSAGRDHSSLADALPDPFRGNLLGLAVPFWIRQGMCGGRGVIIWHQVPIIGHKVTPQLDGFRNRVWQEEFHPAKDV